MFTFKSKPLNSLINAIDNWNDASKKCNQSETTGMTNYLIEQLKTPKYQCFIKI